jgi:hypothetical protein
MYFIFKTSYNFSSAIFDKNTQDMGYFFVHNTSNYENKICGFGKLMAIIAIILAFIRLQSNSVFIYENIIFDLLCSILAISMNLNAFIYIIPIICCEFFILNYKL